MYSQEGYSNVFHFINFTDCNRRGMFYCNTGRCIPAELKCDRFNHCEDNSDESNDNCLRKAFCWINQIANVVYILVYKLSIIWSLLMMYKNFTLEFLHNSFFLLVQSFGTKIKGT